MKKVKHWLHILLTLLTGGLWLPVYVIVVATTEMFNRGYREGKAAGRVAKSNEYEAELEMVRQSSLQPARTTFVDDAGRRVIVGADGDMRFGCTMAPIVDWPERESAEPYVTATMERIREIESNERKQSTFERFKELGDRMLSGDPLDSYEQLEYQQLRKEVVQ